MHGCHDLSPVLIFAGPSYLMDSQKAILRRFAALFMTRTLEL